MNAECLAQKVYMCIWNLQVDIQQSFLKKKKQKQKDKKTKPKKKQIWISLIDCEYNFSNLLLVNI